MNSTPAPIAKATLRELIAAGTVAETLALADGLRFAVVVKTAGIQRLLVSKYGDQCLFASMDTVALDILRVGVARFGVDANEQRNGRSRRARPNRAEALCRTCTRVRPVLLGLETRDG